MPWFPLHTMQQVEGDAVAVAAGLYVLFRCVLAAKVLEAFLVLVTELVELMLSSVLALIDVCFIKPYSSAFCFNESLKLRNVGIGP